MDIDNYMGPTLPGNRLRDQDFYFWFLTIINYGSLAVVFVSFIAIILSAYNSHWGHLAAWFIIALMAFAVCRCAPMATTVLQRQRKAERDEWLRKTGRYR
jgi:hypothetical protein